MSSDDKWNLENVAGLLHPQQFHNELFLNAINYVNNADLQLSLFKIFTKLGKHILPNANTSVVF